MNPYIIVTFTLLGAVFSISDALVYTMTLHKPAITLDEWRANGWARFLPGSGFYLAWKYRNR